MSSETEEGLSSSLLSPWDRGQCLAKTNSQERTAEMTCLTTSSMTNVRYLQESCQEGSKEEKDGAGGAEGPQPGLGGPQGAKPGLTEGGTSGSV